MGRVFVRLLTAIPLLFWVGTAAVAHFVHSCVAVPMDVAADLATGDPVVEAAPVEPVALTDLGSAHQYESEPPAAYVESLSPATLAAPLTAGSLVVHTQVFASSRLFANPPPTAA